MKDYRSLLHVRPVSPWFHLKNPDEILRTRGLFICFISQYTFTSFRIPISIQQIPIWLWKIKNFLCMLFLLPPFLKLLYHIYIVTADTYLLILSLFNLHLEFILQIAVYAIFTTRLYVNISLVPLRIWSSFSGIFSGKEPVNNIHWDLACW